MIDIQLIGLFNATLQAATLLFIAALGELITEKSGILTAPPSKSAGPVRTCNMGESKDQAAEYEKRSQKTGAKKAGRGRWEKREKASNSAMHLSRQKTRGFAKR